MYQSVEHMLCEVFFIHNTLIMGKSNSARIEEWIASKGVSDRCTTGLNQHDLHANSAMILSRIERTLNDIEWILVNAEYGHDLSGIVDLTKYVLSKTNGLAIEESDVILEYLFTRKPSQMAIQDRFNWSKGKLYRKIDRVKRVINKLHCDCIGKLELALNTLISKNR